MLISATPPHGPLPPPSRPAVHTYTWVHTQATFCGVCSKLLWGFSRQGFKCGECGFDAHKHCRHFAPACLGKAGQ